MKEQLLKAEVTHMSPHNRAIYESGKKILLDSTDIGREFCKFMINIALGAIPIYIAITQFIGIDSTTIAGAPTNYVVLALSPFLLYIVSAILYVIGYFPRGGYFNLDSPDEIEQARLHIINKQNFYIILATVLLVSGILAATLSVLNTLLM